MERIVNIAKDHDEARLHDINQVINMTVEERRKVAKSLKKRAFGRNCLDVRDDRKQVTICRNEGIWNK